MAASVSSYQAGHCPWALTVWLGEVLKRWKEKEKRKDGQKEGRMGEVRTENVNGGRENKEGHAEPSDGPSLYRLNFEVRF